jgi:hypothetical protein
MIAYKPALDVQSDDRKRRLLWHPSALTALTIALIGFIAIINLNKQSAFLYFQF